MKAVLVIDIPSELDVNNLLIDYCVHTKGEYKSIRKGGNHPLKPLPQKVEMDFNEYYEGMADGWNACIEKIIDYGGETE